MRVSSATRPLSNSVNLRPVPINNNTDNHKNNNGTPASERISLRARKKLHRETVTRSELYSPYTTNENIRLYNSFLLPASTSSIMAASPTHETPVGPWHRKP
uniref:Uncharacterized protein n=1 Tax=Caenorhabditis japonica TaxID=281687 RepID=A0A8R1IM55_CAEJA